MAHREEQLPQPLPSMGEYSSRMRTLQHIASAQQKGRTAMEMLDEQGAQLDRIGALQQSTTASMDVAEKQLTIMESLTAWIWGGSSSKSRQTKAEESDAAAAPSASATPPRATAAHEAEAWEFVPRELTDDGDDYVGEVRSGVAQLRHMALRIGDTLDTQNQQLEALHGRADTLDARVGKANMRISGLLK
jgi:hypothetical protein